MSEEIILINHASHIWPGARHLHVRDTGRLLCITRDPVRDAAKRLIEENYDPASVLVIRDAADSVPELRSNSLTEAAKPEVTKR
jgi:hypothetical protein